MASTQTLRVPGAERRPPVRTDPSSSGDPFPHPSPPPVPSFPADGSALPLSHFRAHLLHALQSSGALSQLKTQLKSHIVTALTHPSHPSQPPPLSSISVPSPSVLPLTRRLCHALVADFLHAFALSFTLPIFLAETGGAEGRASIAFQPSDLLRLLRAAAHGRLGRQLAERVEGGTNALYALVEAMVEVEGSEVRATATDAQSQTQSELSERVGGVDSLDRQLKAVDDAALLTAEAERALPLRAVEERMARWEREAAARSAAEVEEQVAHYKRAELDSMRQHERALYHTQLKAMHEQQRAQSAQQAAAHRARIDQLEAEMERRVKALDEERFHQRQRVMEEMDALKARERDMQRADALIKRELSVEAEGWKERCRRMDEALQAVDAERRGIEERIARATQLLRDELATATTSRDEALRAIRDDRDALRAELEKATAAAHAAQRDLLDSRHTRDLLDERLREANAKLSVVQHFSALAHPAPIADSDGSAALLSRVERELDDTRARLDEEKRRHAAEVREVTDAAEAAVVREQERGHSMMVSLSAQWKDAYDLLVLEYESALMDRDRRRARRHWRPEEPPIRSDGREEHRRAQSARSPPSSTPSPGAAAPQAAVGASRTRSPALPVAQGPPAAEIVLTTASPALTRTAGRPSSPSPATLPAARLPVDAPVESPPLPPVSHALSPVGRSSSPSESALLTPFHLLLPRDGSRASPTSSSRSFLPMASLDDSHLFSPSPASVQVGNSTWELEESKDDEEVQRLAVESVAHAREEAKRREREERERVEREGVQRREEENVRSRAQREVAEQRVREERERKLREAALLAEKEKTERQEREERAEREEREGREQREADEREARALAEKERREAVEVAHAKEQREREERLERRRAERQQRQEEEDEEKRSARLLNAGQLLHDVSPPQEPQLAPHSLLPLQPLEPVVHSAVSALERPAKAVAEEKVAHEESDAERLERERRERMADFVQRARAKREAEAEVERIEERKERTPSAVTVKALIAGVGKTDTDEEDEYDEVEEDIEVEADDS